MIRIATVFSGIGAPEFALRRLGLEHKTIFACDNNKISLPIEIDNIIMEKQKEDPTQDIRSLISESYDKVKKKNFVRDSYLQNHDLDTVDFHYDIKYINGKKYKDSIDLIIGGSPCQSFTLFGYQKGLNEARGTLFYDFARLIHEVKPKAFIYENVKGMLTHDKKKTWKVVYRVFDDLGYDTYHRVINSADHGIPQTRRRVFIIGFKSKTNFFFPDKRPLQYTMQDFLEENVRLGHFSYEKGGALKLGKTPPSKEDSLIRLKKYFLSEKIKPGILSPGSKGFYMKPKTDLKIARTLMSSMHKMHRAGVDNYVTTFDRLRRLTPREALRLMGFTDDFKQVVSDTQLYQQAGNSMVVDVMMDLIREILRRI